MRARPLSRLALALPLPRLPLRALPVRALPVAALPLLALPLLALPLLALPLLTGCGGGGSDCPAGEVLAEGMCVPAESCTPGALRCVDARSAETCAADGQGWVPEETCGLEEICREGMCLATFACEDEEPACCATMAQCGDILQPNDCPECLPISRSGWCDAGACHAPEGESVSLYLVGDGEALPSGTADRVESAVATVYHAYTADGSVLDCEHLLAGGTDSRHDAQDPFLNPVYSQPMGVQILSGSDQFEISPGTVPVGTEELVVITVYDQAGGAGHPLGRGCIDGIDTTQATQFVVPLTGL